MLKGKTTVITGCLQGIGKQAVKTFAENGSNVIACAYEESKEFEDYCDKVSKLNGVEIIPIYFDMRDNDSVKKAAKQIMGLKKEIHGLVNVAGINKDAYFNMMTHQDLVDTFQINFFSQIIFTQYIVRWMQRKKTKGSIVFTSSSTALFGIAGQTAYGASKASLIGAMRCMAIELGGDGIRVNVVAPGVIETPMTEALDKSIIDERIRKIDIPNIGTSEDVANMYMYLISDLSDHITGQVLRVDGGM